jgi:hypothetical protein
MRLLCKGGVAVAPDDNLFKTQTSEISYSWTKVGIGHDHRLGKYTILIPGEFNCGYG